MTWATDPATWVVGAVLTAAQLNTEVRERFRYIKGSDGEIVFVDYPDFPSTAQGDVFYHNGTKLARLAAGTLNYFLKTQGAAANPVWSEPLAPSFAAGEQYLHANDTVRVTSSATYVKLKESKISRGGTLTVKFDLSGSIGEDPVYGKVYVNAGAVGTERTVTSTAYTTFSENFTIVAGDLIQVYGKRVITENAQVRNLRFYALAADAALATSGY